MAQLNTGILGQHYDTGSRYIPRGTVSLKPHETAVNYRFLTLTLWITAVFVVFSGIPIKKPHGIWLKALLFHNKWV